MRVVMAGLIVVCGAALGAWVWSGQPVPLAGVEFRAGEAGPLMRMLPGGRFTVGSPEDEVGRQPSEAQSNVDIAPFALAVHELSVAEFAAFVEASGHVSEAERGGSAEAGCFGPGADGRFGWQADLNWRDPGFPQAENHPVVCVSWNDVIAYLDWRNAGQQTALRLPTEAELEYAVRAGSGSAWPWGEEADAGCASSNYADAALLGARPGWAYPVAGCHDGHAYTAPLGSYPANPLGLRDTLGNVWEWSASCWRDRPGDAETAGPCESRVMRGGAWAYAPERSRSASRGGHAPSFRSVYAGARLALDASAAQALIDSRGRP